MFQHTYVLAHKSNIWVHGGGSGQRGGDYVEIPGFYGEAFRLRRGHVPETHGFFYAEAFPLRLLLLLLSVCECHLSLETPERWRTSPCDPQAFSEAAHEFWGSV